jgi:hypothetical protein
MFVARANSDHGSRRFTINISHKLNLAITLRHIVLINVNDINLHRADSTGPQER